MERDDDLIVIRKEVSSKDILKRIFNEAERGPRKPLLDAEARKAKLKAEKESRSKKGKKIRADRLASGLCTRCGSSIPVLGSRMCSNCQLKGREYMKGR